MVISLHACDTATDAVLERAIELGARVILSTPCCHRYMKDKIHSPALSFITRYPHIAGKLNEAVTDALRAEMLRAAGYRVTATELTDPDDTPKNTLIRAVKRRDMSRAEADRLQGEVREILAFLTGDADFPYPIRPCTEGEKKE